MRRFLALLLGYRYYLDTDGDTVIRVIDGHKFSNALEFLHEVGLKKWDEVKDHKLIYKDKKK